MPDWNSAIRPARNWLREKSPLSLVSDAGGATWSSLIRPHQIAERFHGRGVVEREAVAVLEHAARRPDVVEVDALQVVGRVVAPLPDPSGVETRVPAACPSASRVSRASSGRKVSSPSGLQRKVSSWVGIDTGRGEQVRVVVHGDAGVGQLRHAPQHAAAGELVDHRRLPVAALRPVDLS